MWRKTSKRLSGLIRPRNANTCTTFRQQQRQQHRCFASKFTMDEERQIMAALRWMEQRKPSIVVQMEKIQLVGCNFLPKQAQRSVESASIRIKCLTFCDQMSDQALQQQVALCLAQERRRGYDNTAIFCLDLNTRYESTKGLGRIKEALFGAAVLCQNQPSPHTCLVLGMPNAGKSSLILPLTIGRTLRVKKKQAYHLPRVSAAAGRTLGLKKHVLDATKTTKITKLKQLTLVDSPGLRPKLKSTDERALAFLLAARVTEFYKGFKDDVDPSIVLELCLHALHRHANVSETVPPYVGALGLAEPVATADEFVQAFRTSMRNKSLQELELIKKCQNGDFGGMIFTPTAPEAPVPELELHRNGPIVYMNQAAQRLVEVGTNPTDNVQPLPVKFNRPPPPPLSEMDELEDDPRFDKGEGRIVQLPEHRRHFNCMKCAGFIKRDAGLKVFGCRHTRILGWKYLDIVAYFSRMAEAFGGNKSAHVMYLMKDSLACTLMAKHKKRSRAAAYKLYDGIKEYPLPNHLRPHRFRSDQPIPLSFKCTRFKNSCMEHEPEEVREKLHAPKWHPKMDAAKKKRQLLSEQLAAEQEEEQIDA